MTRLERVLVAVAAVAACAGPTRDAEVGRNEVPHNDVRINEIRINEIQVIGSHNSYKAAIDPSVMGLITQADSATARSLDYAHLPLNDQLEAGVRKFELDLFHDPAGGRYANPLGVQLVKQAGLPDSPPYDADGVMRGPGFKVLHVQDMDFRSNHPTFQNCLETLLAWSDRHPRHVPVYVMIECKEGRVNRPGFVVPLPFTKGALDSVDAAILDVIPRNRLIAPDDIRGGHQTLEEAVLAGRAWPRLARARGKFVFFLLANDARRALYTAGHPSLRGRAMFVTAPAGTPEAAVMNYNNPVRDRDSIVARVRAGYIVRTRSDAGTIQARSGDRSRFEAAMASGAQIISTDYYRDDPRFAPDYAVAFPESAVARINPVLRPGLKEPGLIE